MDHSDTSVEWKLNQFQNLMAHTLTVKHNHAYNILIKEVVLMSFQHG